MSIGEEIQKTEKPAFAIHGGEVPPFFFPDISTSILRCQRTKMVDDWGCNEARTLGQPVCLLTNNKEDKNRKFEVSAA